MKKIKIIFALSVAALGISLAGCGKTNNSKLPSIEVHEVRRVPMYMSYDDGAPALGCLIVHHFNDENVGYLNIKDLYDLINSIPDITDKWTLKQNGNVFEITNGLGTCVIDFGKQTIAYINYDGYTSIPDDPIPYMDCLIAGGKEYFVTAMSKSKYRNVDVERSISLSDYNIPIYYENGNGYMPIEVMTSNVFAMASLALVYNGNAAYVGGLDSIEAAKKIKETGNIYTKDYMEYTYNLLALTMDSNYGLDQKKSLVTEGKTYHYLASGAYKALEKYHDALVSTEPNVSNGALHDFMANEIDDAGHTGFTGINVFCDENFDNAEFQHFGQEISYRWALSSSMKSLRKTAGYDPSDVVDSQTGLVESGATHSYQEIGGVAYITFDSFTGGGSSRTTPIDITNYWQNTIYTVHYANEQIRANNIKNLVIDLSVNGGGEAIAENFIASWVCNGVTTKTRNTKDKTYAEQTHYADIDFDGAYTTNDYLPEDVNVYCIVNANSFSCGNLLPWHLKEQSSTKFIGDRSGGGSCEVKTNVPTGLGGFYQMSKPIQLGSMQSTSYDNFISVEDGVKAEWYPISVDSKEDAQKYYDRVTINTKILA